MARAAAAFLLRHIQTMAGRPTDAQIADGQLLQRFTAGRDQAAFEALLHRHGPMVLRVARRLLDDSHAAEDVFQATFLALARRAGSIRRGASVASWLHGVAYRLALKLRIARTRERAVASPPAVPVANDPLEAMSARELILILDEEVERLPARYRDPILLCYWEGRTHAEAAQRLGCPLGTLRNRLERARELLRCRLMRRGIALPAALLVTGLTDGETLAAALVQSTARAALAYANGQAALAGLASARAVALGQDLARVMLSIRLKVGAALLLTVGMVAAGAGILIHRALAVQQPEQAVVANTERPPDSVALVAPSTRPTTDQQAEALHDDYGDPLPAGAIRRLGTLRFRHSGGTINALLVSADGKVLVSNNHYGDRAVCAWELATGKLLHRFPGHYEENGAVALSPDGKTVVTGEDKLIRFWDLGSGREVRQLKSPLGDVQGLAFSPDGKTLASGHASDTVLLWDLATETSLARLSAKHNRLNFLTFTRDGKTLLTGDSLDPTIRLFDVATRKERQRLTRPTVVRGIDLSPDAKLLALGAQEGGASLWDVNSGKLVRQLAGGPFVAGVAFSPDGKLLASAEWDLNAHTDAVALWDVATGGPLRRLEKNIGPVWRLVFTPDGKTLITGSGSTIRLLDPTTGEERGPASGNPAYAGGVVLSPDGRTLAYSADASVRLWDMAAGREAGRLAGDHWSLAFSPDSKTLYGGTDVNKVNVWDVASHRLIRRLESDPKKGGFDWVAYYRVAVSPNGKVLASAGRGLLPGGRSVDAVVQLWDLAVGKELGRFSMKEGVDEFVTAEGAVAFSPDGRTLAASGRGPADGNRVRVWDPVGGRLFTRLSAALSGSASKGSEPPSFPQGPIIEPRIAFSPDGKMLAMSRQQKIITVWEAATGGERLQLKGHEEPTLCVAFSPDGRTLASAGWDQTLRLWDLESGKELRQLRGHRGTANSLAFSADGKLLISAGDDTTILFWDVAAVTQRPRRRLDQMSPQEWEALWSDLAAADAARAYGAMQRMIAVPGVTVDCLKQRLRPAPAIEPQTVTRLLAELDNQQFAVRERAAQEINQLGGRMEIELRKALARPDSSLELRRRLEAALERIEVPAGPQLREIRAVEILERVGTRESQQALAMLGNGFPEARLTQEARAALQRCRLPVKPAGLPSNR